MIERVSSVQQSSLFVRPKAGAGGKVYWDAQWRYRIGSEEPWRQKTRRLGLAWQEADGSGGWRKRSGRCPDGWLDERAANVAAVAAMEAYELELLDERREADRAAAYVATVRELGEAWLLWLEQVRGAKPSTIRDYRTLLREPGQRYKRGTGESAGRIMAAFGDRPIDEVSTKDVTRFLRGLDAEGLTPRNVNKYEVVPVAVEFGGGGSGVSVRQRG